MRSQSTATQLHLSLIYHSSTQRTTPQVKISLKFAAVPHCSSWCRDGNSGTATYHNAAAVNYERSLIDDNRADLIFGVD